MRVVLNCLLALGLAGSASSQLFNRYFTRSTQYSSHTYCRIFTAATLSNGNFIQAGQYSDMPTSAKVGFFAIHSRSGTMVVFGTLPEGTNQEPVKILPVDDAFYIVYNTAIVGHGKDVAITKFQNTGNSLGSRADQIRVGPIHDIAKDAVLANGQISIVGSTGEASTGTNSDPFFYQIPVPSFVNPTITIHSNPGGADYASSLCYNVGLNTYFATGSLNGKIMAWTPGGTVGTGLDGFGAGIATDEVTGNVQIVGTFFSPVSGHVAYQETLSSNFNELNSGGFGLMGLISIRSSLQPKVLPRSDWRWVKAGNKRNY